MKRKIFQFQCFHMFLQQSPHPSFSILCFQWVDLRLKLILKHGSIRDCLRHCYLIGPENDNDSFKKYRNVLLQRWIKEQLQYFPNSKKVIDFWIITAYEVFHKIIVEDKLPVSEMPPVQLSSLMASTEKEIMEHATMIKSNAINAVLKEVTHASNYLNIPSK